MSCTASLVSLFDLSDWLGRGLRVLFRRCLQPTAKAVMARRVMGLWLWCFIMSCMYILRLLILSLEHTRCRAPALRYGVETLPSIMADEIQDAASHGEPHKLQKRRPLGLPCSSPSPPYRARCVRERWHSGSSRRWPEARRTRLPNPFPCRSFVEHERSAILRCRRTAPRAGAVTSISNAALGAWPDLIRVRSVNIKEGSGGSGPSR